MIKERPIDFITNHKDLILESYQQNNHKPKITWYLLQEKLPKISQQMSFNTFKQYVTVYYAAYQQFKEKEERLKMLKNEHINLNNQVKKLEKKLYKVTQKSTNQTLVRQKLDSDLKKIAGWNVQQAKDGYYRCYRKIKKKVHTIYIGKTLDVKKARKRIKEKENALRLYKK